MIGRRNFFKIILSAIASIFISKNGYTKDNRRVIWEEYNIDFVNQKAISTAKVIDWKKLKEVQEYFINK